MTTRMTINGVSTCAEAGTECPVLKKVYSD